MTLERSPMQRFGRSAAVSWKLNGLSAVNQSWTECTAALKDAKTVEARAAILDRCAATSAESNSKWYLMLGAALGVGYWYGKRRR